MTDDPFAKFDPADSAYNPSEQAQDNDPFAAYDPVSPAYHAKQSSALGAAARGAERAAIPLTGSFYTAGAGAEAGAMAGAPLGPVGAAVGGLAGGLAGALGGGYLIGKAQNYALSKLPDSWKEAIGQDDRQQQLDQSEHSIASFIGGTAPFLLTMRPGAAAKVALPANATAMQQIMANPTTARVFGGGAMGGMEAISELTQGEEHPDWTKVLIATGTGAILNKQTRLGEYLTNKGAGLVRPGTVAEAHDLKIMGPGVTEAVARGEHEMDPEAAQTAHATRAAEMDIAGEATTDPDLHARAREADPELFTKYDALTAQRDELRNWLSEYQKPGYGQIDEAMKALEAARQAYDAHVESKGGYTGSSEARRLRVGVREAEKAYDELFARREAFGKGEAVETPESAKVRERLQAIDYQLRDIGRNVSAAYRFAADHTGAPTIEPVTAPIVEPAPAPKTAFGGLLPLAERPGEATAAGAAPISAKPVEAAAARAEKPIADQKAEIAEDVARQLIEAGRPERQARASGALIAERFATLAGQFKGALGTALELYRREGAIIRGPGRAASVNPAKEPVPPNFGFGKVSKPERPVSLLEFLSMKGLAPSPELATIFDALPMGGWEDEFLATVEGKTVLDRAADYLRTGEETSPLEAWRRSYEQHVNEQLPVYEQAHEPSPWDEFFQSANGKIALRPGKKPIITLLRKADASTFIHETGHDFLEQLLRFAKHELAPESLKKDAETALKWLKAKDGEKITTAQHEKFARGFEQYLREGVAPSKELAGVFAQFKQWLLHIYETLKGLGESINDDIRGVFDRMLAEEPQRTVIAPEREPQPTIHDIHEEDARLITGEHEAEPAMDRIAAETKRAIEDIPEHVRPEIEAKLAEHASREGSARAGAAPEMGEGGGEPGPVARGGDMGAENLPLVEGGAETRGAGEPTSRGNAAPPLAPRSKPILGAEPRFIDRAGNIRVENLTSSEDVAAAIHEAAAANNEFLGDRRGVVSDGQVMDLASDIGMDGAFDLVKGWVKGRAYNAEQVMALRKLLIDSAEKVHAAMQKAAAGTDEDVLAYAMARDRHQMIQRTVAGATAEAGRALRAFRDLTKQAGGKAFDQLLRDATGRTLFQLRQEAQLGMSLDSPQNVSKFMQSAQKRSFLKMIQEYWINALISSVQSQLTYTVGTAGLALDTILERSLAAGIGKLARTAGREGEVVHLAEVKAALAGARKGFAPALEAAGTAAKTGVSGTLPGEKVHLSPFETASNLAPRGALNEDYKLAQMKGDLFGAFRGMYDAILTAGAALKAGGEAGAPLVGLNYPLRGEIPNIEVKGVSALPVGDILRLPSRMNSIFDSFTRALLYSTEKDAQAYRIAANEAEKAGEPLNGPKMNARIADLMRNPTEEMMATARTYADETTLLDKGGAWINKLQSFLGHEFSTPLGDVALAKFVVPFARVAANTIKQAVKRSPGAVLYSDIRADLSGKNGTRAQDMAAARIIAGTALGATFAYLRAGGFTRGTGSKDPAKEAIERRVFGPSQSVRIGDFWYDYRGLGTLGLMLNLSADAYEISQHVGEEEADEIASRLLYSFSQNILNQSAMKGPSDLMKAMQESERYGNSYVRGLLSSFTPFGTQMGQIARQIDPNARQARTLIDSVKAKIPWLSEELLPRRDIWGEEIPNRIPLGRITTFYAEQAQNDPVDHAFVQAGYYPAQVDRQIRGVKLSDEQYDDYVRIAGRMTKQRLDVLVNSPDFERFSPHIRHDALKAQIEASREVARNVVMAKYPEIIEQARQAKLGQ